MLTPMECGISLQIVAGGNIVVSNRLDMKVKQETFSVALSRDMVPSARLLAYYIFDGEVVSDCLNFFVNGTGQNPVSRMRSSLRGQGLSAWSNFVYVF